MGAHERPRLPPVEAEEWLYVAIIALLLVTVVCEFVWRSHWLWLCARLVLFAAAIGVIVRPLTENSWTTIESICWFAGTWAAAAAVTTALEKLDRRGSNSWILAALTAIAGLDAVVLMMSGSQTYGQLAATVPAVLFPMLVLNIMRGGQFVSPHAPAIFVLLTGGMLLSGQLYASLTPLNALLLFFAPLALWWGQIPALRKRKIWKRGAFQLAVALTPAVIATALALQKFLIDMAERATSGY
jgi:membrane-associated HD superfamily phosphohydrolase